MKLLNEMANVQVKLASEKIEIHKKRIKEAELIEKDKLENGKFDTEYYRAKAIIQVNREDVNYWLGVLNTSKPVLEYTNKYL